MPPWLSKSNAPPRRPLRWRLSIIVQNDSKSTWYCPAGPMCPNSIMSFLSSLDVVRSRTSAKMDVSSSISMPPLSSLS